MKNNLIIAFMLCVGLQLGAHLSASDTQAPVKLAIKKVDINDLRTMLKELTLRAQAVTECCMMQAPRTRIIKEKKEALLIELIRDFDSLAFMIDRAMEELNIPRWKRHAYITKATKDLKNTPICIHCVFSRALC